MSILQDYGITKKNIRKVLKLDNTPKAEKKKNNDFSVQKAVQEASDSMKQFAQDRIDDITDMIFDILQKSMAGVVYALEAKGEYSSEHSGRVSVMVERLTGLMGIRLLDAKSIYMAASVHDIGKIGIPDSVLLAPRRLSNDEFEIMKTHPSIGARILEKTLEGELNHDHFGFAELHSNSAKTVCDGVKYHHERWDGKGYPEGLKEEAIPLASRIIAICDSTDAMLSDRVYRKALSEEECKEEIRKNMGVMYDPDIAVLFLEKWELIVGDLYNIKKAPDKGVLYNDTY